MPTRAVPREAPSTRKGRATRERIVAAAADLMYRHGVAGTSTPAVRDAAGVSSSQIYHYFAGKDDLTRAVIEFQAEAIMSHQAPLLAIDSLEALRAWCDVVVDVARRQNGAGGCPLGSLSSELSDDHPWAREALAAGFIAWSEAIRASLAAMVDNGTLRPEADATALSLALLAALQGGLVLAQAQHDTSALEAALDAVITHIHDYAVR
ncbi:TetR/AcrR family transcriptional regulator [Mycolicibacter sp. MYC123]|uniref:TetR/AcrR family transcriptional regulator n=1 Tax=[Mycobacterium] zoologicum TaxID=2872311 RepID=A0ABU5YII1_9MYCO|nr:MULTISPECIES: TetR/AcrR family transcriptional regulator [unclassified Mycolicibacter]MEB3049865.1 TetR/AcrR family transcriptional regulator [Mycolicibacter sp. MYC123]MEB3062244.1 TetR/AcrR family transcriptional regulator [Mycolicibacter sp. MYC101]